MFVIQTFFGVHEFLKMQRRAVGSHSKIRIIFEKIHFFPRWISIVL